MRTTRSLATIVTAAALALAGCGGGDDGGGGGSGGSSLTPERVRDFTVKYLEDPANKDKVPVSGCPGARLEKRDADGFKEMVVTCDSPEPGAVLVIYAEYPDAASARKVLEDPSTVRLIDRNVVVSTSNKYFDEVPEEGTPQAEGLLGALKAECGCGDIALAES